MPALGTAQLPKETLTAFSGLNLRVDPLAVREHELLRSINADLHTEMGVIRARAGRTLLSGVNLGDHVYGLFRHAGRRYQVAGTTLYRDFTSILTGLAGYIRPTVFPYQPLNDETTWSFIADFAVMRKDDGATVHTWGIVAPLASPVLATGAAGSLSGTYGAVYTYARVVGASIAHESNPCPNPTPATLASQVLSVPVVGSTDPQVTHIRIYRTVAGGSIYLFDQMIGNGTTTAVSSQPDDALGTAVETDNDPPPLAACAVEFQGHIFLCNDPVHPDYLWYSKRYRPESFPPDQFLKIGNPDDPLLSMVALTGVVGVFTPLTKYRVFGNSVSGFTAVEALNSRGIASPNATASTARGVAFVAKDGIWLTNFVEADQELSGGIQGLFAGRTIHGYNPIDFTTLGTPITLAEYKRRLYFGYNDTTGQPGCAVYSPETQHWYHYNHDTHVLNYEEDTDQLTVGGSSGDVSILETGTSDAGAAITVDVVFPPRDGGDRFAKKGYAWLGVDSRGAQPWVFTFLTDDAVVHTTSVYGPRLKRYQRLPEHTAGQHWQVGALYAGTDTAALYAIEVLQTRHEPGEVWVQDSQQPTWYVQILPGSPTAQPHQSRRFTHLVLDADTGTGGVWAADLFVDDRLAASLAIPEPHHQGFYALPSGLTGSHWHTILRYSGADVPLVHSLDLVDAGAGDGQIWIAGPGQAAGSFQTILPASEPVNPFIKKRFLYAKLDLESGAGVWTLSLLVDDVKRQTITVAGARAHTLIRLAPGILGSTWRIEAQYSALPIPPFYRALMVTQELRVA